MATRNSRLTLFYSRRGQTKERSTVHWGIWSAAIRARLRREARQRLKRQRKRHARKSTEKRQEQQEQAA